MSPPSRGRGLKLCARDGPDERHGGRPPSRGRGLKFLDVKDLSAADVSPPLAGAWIEISSASIFSWYAASPPLAGAWNEILSLIHIQVSAGLLSSIAVAPPRGGVD